MIQETLNPPADGQSVTGLVSGILEDAQQLFKQQMALVRAEIKADLQQGVRAAALLGVGVLVLVPAIFLLCNMLVFLLHEQAGLSIWSSYGIVGGTFALLGVVLVCVGVQRFRALGSQPNQSVESFKENVRWMTNPK